MSTSTLDNPYTGGIARFVSGLQYDAIPTEVRERIKLLMLDSLGCALYGSHLEWCRILQDTLTRVDQTRDCAVWGTNLRLSSPHAALVNGTEVQGFELDDVHRAGVLHVGAVVLPALISIAETRGHLSGRDFITAAVAGYEIGPRVGLCMGPEHIGQGWHSGATLGVFSAAAGAARGLGLDVEKTVHALGIAGTQSSGLMAAQYGAMVKRMHAGRASQSGLYGALFAENGLTGIVNVLESEYGGFCTTFSRSTDRFNLDELTAGLGTTWQTMGVALKFYSCGLTSAQLNLPFCVATWLIEGDCFVEQFTDDIVADPARMALAEKVVVFHDEAITARGAKFRHMVRVRVVLKDGATLECTKEYARGSERNFSSADDIVEKFEKLASHAFDRPQVEALRDAMLGLDKLENARTVARLLALP